MADLQDDVKFKSVQYADTTLFVHTRVAIFWEQLMVLRSSRLDRLGAYSCESHLAVNANKTKWVLAMVSIPHTSFYHSLHENQITLACNGKALQRMNVNKLLPRCLPGLTLRLE